MKTVRIGIVGVGGFARSHLSSIAHCIEKGFASLDAVVIRDKDKGSYLETEKEMREKGVRIYRNYESMLEKEKGSLELIAIPCGIDQHEEISVRSLESGYNVICEKPAAGNMKQIKNMRKAQKHTGKILAIGYQNIFTPSIQRIKQIAISGELGRLLSAKTYVMWARSSAYYNRHNWAGKIRFAGKDIYDSPAQNATAHFLQNMLYVSGSLPDESAEIESVYGENYRVKDIESADTQFIRVKTKAGVSIEFITTHATLESEGPVTRFDFEKGYIVWDEQKNALASVYEGRGDSAKLIEEIDAGDIPRVHRVFENVCTAINEDKQPLCTIHNAYQHTLCVENSFASSNGVNKIDAKYTKRIKAEKEAYDTTLDASSAEHVVIDGIEDVIRSMYENSKSFYEASMPWAKEGNLLHIDS